MRTPPEIPALAILVLWGVTASVGNEVEVVGTTVSLTCPIDNLEAAFSWSKVVEGKPAPIPEQTGRTYKIIEYSEDKDGEYQCKSGEESQQFYIRVKVCDGCIDLSPGTVIGIICGDLLLTLLVALSVYCFAKRQGGGSKDFHHRPYEANDIPPPRPSELTSPPQNPHYAPIKGGQRDVYDKLQRKY